MASTTHALEENDGDESDSIVNGDEASPRTHRLQNRSTFMEAKQHKLRVGTGHQCTLFKSDASYKPNKRKLSCLVYDPSRIKHEEVYKYGQEFKEKFGTLENHLSFLHAADYNKEKAFNLKEQSKPTGCYAWSFDDKLTFQQLLRMKNKNFVKIAEGMPGKPVGEILDYYYNVWVVENKNIDTMIRLSDANGGVGNNNNDSELGDKTERLQEVEKLSNLDASKRVGAYFDAKEISDSFDYDVKINTLKILFNFSKQFKTYEDEAQIQDRILEALEARSNAVTKIWDDIRSDIPNKTTESWSAPETKLALVAFYYFGRDYAKISKLLKTKTEQQVAKFAFNFSWRYKIEDIIDMGYEDREESEAASDQGSETDESRRMPKPKAKRGRPRKYRAPSATPMQVDSCTIEVKEEVQDVLMTELNC